MASNKFEVILDDEDTATLRSLARIFNALVGVASLTEKPLASNEADTGSNPVPRSNEPQESVPSNPTRRRSRLSAEPKATAPDAGKPTPEATSTAPTTRRSRITTPAPAPTPPAQADTPSTVSESAPSIDDDDVVRACSLAARSIGPEGVHTIMAKYTDTRDARKIAADKREAFVAELTAAVAK